MLCSEHTISKFCVKMQCRIKARWSDACSVSSIKVAYIVVEPVVLNQMHLHTTIFNVQKCTKDLKYGRMNHTDSFLVFFYMALDSVFISLHGKEHGEHRWNTFWFWFGSLSSVYDCDFLSKWHELLPLVQAFGQHLFFASFWAMGFLSCVSSRTFSAYIHLVDFGSVLQEQICRGNDQCRK